ncbi:MAG: ImmA/IrrE family metallo-endopeptidase [Armatimonadia bacterium]|nr:ImmA/IrrE family metallo-endopeptidase [Armatimonadia bacterium]
MDYGVSALAKRANLPNPDLLRWAREAADLTAEEMARHLRVHPDAVAAWEAGETGPTFRQLEKYAAKTQRSVAVFYLPVPPVEPPPPQDFRHLPGATPGVYSGELRLAVRKLRNALEDLSMIASLSGDQVALSLPSVSLSMNPSAAGDSLRASLGVTLEQQLATRSYYAAMDLWSEALFVSGVLVQKYPFEVAEARGFSIIQGHLAGIGISTRDADTARIFSLLHEVAHIGLRMPGVSIPAEHSDPSVASEATPPSSTVAVERFCNAVAAEILLPSTAQKVHEGLRGSRDDSDGRALAQTAQAFGVSRHVVARRMLELDYIDEPTYWRTVKDLGTGRHRDPSGGSFYRNTLSRTGKPFASYVLEAADRNLISSSTAADALVIKPTQLDRLRLELVGEGRGK